MIKLIQVTLIQIDNYGPWTVTPNPRAEPDLQALQSRLYGDLEREFGARGGIVFFNRFDNLIAISNGINYDEHLLIQQSIKNRYPFTISMGVGCAENAIDAQAIATKLIQQEGGSQSQDRCEVLKIDSLAPEDDDVQIAHIDIDDITNTLTDVETAFDTSIIVYDVLLSLMRELSKIGGLCFFIGGDNYMAPTNNISKSQLRDAIAEVDKQTGVKLKAGIGIAKKPAFAADNADIGLEKIRDNLTDDTVIVIQ